MSLCRYSHVLITRPLPEAMDLSSRLSPLLNSLDVQALIQPAQVFTSLQISVEVKAKLLQLTSTGSAAPGESPIVIFSSPRAVEFGLRQIPAEHLKHASIGAMGPATAKALMASGLSADLVAGSPHDSEAMMAALTERYKGTGLSRISVIIVAAPDGRKTLAEWLADQQSRVLILPVYSRQPADLEESVTENILQASRVLSVWTSSEAMNSLSKRLPPAAWFKLCQGEWLVISKRLQRLARAFGPEDVQVSSGPSNADLATAVRTHLLKQD